MSKNLKTCSIKKATLLSSSAYCKLCLNALSIHITCNFASSTLKIRRGSSTAYVRPKSAIFDQKTGIFGRFFHEKWQILVHTHAANRVFVLHMPL